MNFVVDIGIHCILEPILEDKNMGDIGLEALGMSIMEGVVNQR